MVVPPKKMGGTARQVWVRLLPDPDHLNAVLAVVLFFLCPEGNLGSGSDDAKPLSACELCILEVEDCRSQSIIKA